MLQFSYAKFGLELAFNKAHLTAVCEKKDKNNEQHFIKIGYSR